jgi:hypothetical protein
MGLDAIRWKDISISDGAGAEEFDGGEIDLIDGRR